jgi:hypothetical protein
MPGHSSRKTYIAAVLLITIIAAFLRFKTVQNLQVDYDELVYLPDAFRYSEMITNHEWKRIADYDESMEHPPFNKLLFAVDLRIRKPKEPDWEALDVGKPIRAEDQSAFFGPRSISAVGGTLQVLITSLVNPLGGLFMALNTYHIKYSAQVYLEGIPGLMAILAVFLFEFAVPKRSDIEAARLNWQILILSAAALGLAAAGKYLYAIVGFVLLAFLILRTRSIRACLLFSVAALLVFFIADPFLWPNPPVRLWKSLTYHWHYAHSDHVVRSAMPWYSPIYFLLRSAPTEWHPGVFYTGVANMILLPLSLIGLVRALRERPIWVAWAAAGLVLLLLWPTKWPQYTLVIVPPISVCAGFGIEQIIRLITNALKKA